MTTPEESYKALWDLTTRAQAALWQIHAITKLMNSYEGIHAVDFPLEISGAIHALQVISESAYKEMGEAL